MRSARADGFSFTDITCPVAVAIEVGGGLGLSRASGLPDDLFVHDGQITKRPIRAMTLSALAPRAGERLWDIGAGSGSISVEWCLAAPGAFAVAVETRNDRVANIRANAAGFGLSHQLSVVEATAPDDMGALPVPDAVFIGGGVSAVLLESLWRMIPVGTRLVANAVTLESEALFANWQADKGGELLKMELSAAAPLGRMRAWDRARPVIQWSVVR
jgi:precorrin-6Y C5,15-methyltransferase (decarboxylating)